MANSRVDSFLDLLRKSSLLTSEQLAEAVDAAHRSDDPKPLAKTLVHRELISRWQAAQLLAGRSSFFLGKYKLIELLGRGGMGGVFLARHVTMNRRVALKIVSKKVGKDPASLERFLSEARAIAALDHPNIVRAYSLDNEGDRYYIVMEFIEGQDLQRMVEMEGPLDYAVAADYIRQAADGLSHAHGRNMIHCDVKPANLLVNDQGTVKILDMGLARLTDAVGTRDEGLETREEEFPQPLTPSPQPLQEEQILGTVDYQAPEQGLQSPNLDHRADIYSLGCTLYFLLTGHPPFPQGTLHERIVKHQTRQPRGIAKERPGAPADLVKICRKMMAKNPDDRFQSADQISQLLADWRPPKRRLLRAVPLDESARADETDGDEAASAPGGKLSGIVGAVLSRTADIFTPPRRIVLVVAVAVLAALGLLAGVIAYFSTPGPGRDESERVGVPSTEEKPPPFEDDIEEFLAKPQYVDEQKDKPPRTDADEKPEEKPAGKPAEKKPKPDKPPEEKPKPDKPPQQKPKPEKPPEEKPKPQEKGPLRDFKPLVALPLLGEQSTSGQPPDAPFELGKIHTAGDIRWQLSLLGGEDAIAGSRKLVLQPKDTDPAKASWLVQLETRPSGSQRTSSQMARIWRDGATLMFQWTEGAPANLANCLRNCVLQVQVAGETRKLLLLQTRQIEPVLINLERAAARGSTTLNWLPETDKLRVEITKVEGGKDYKLVPSEPSPPKTRLTLTFPRKDRHNNEQPGVEFKGTCTVRGSKLNVDLRIPKKTAAVFKQLTVQLKRFPSQDAEELKKGIKESRDATAKEMAKATGEKKTALGKQLDLIDAQLWYLDFYSTVHNRAMIHFSLFFEVDGQKIVLATTEPPK